MSDIKNKYDIKKLDDLEFVKNAKEVKLTHNYISSIVGASDFKIQEPSNVVKMRRISFVVEEDRGKKVRDKIKATSWAEVGTRIFEYYWQMEEMQ